MKKLPYIRDSRKFYGKYEVVATQDLIIPCYNLATARSVVKDIEGEKNANSNGRRNEKSLRKRMDNH